MNARSSYSLWQQRWLRGCLGACAAAFVTIALTPRAWADFIVPNWMLEIMVDEEPGPSDGRGFYTAQNPFHASHSACLPGHATTAYAEYDISWLLNYGNFLIEADLAAEGTSDSLVRSLAGGSIYVQPTTDLPVALHADCTYDLPADWMEARLKMSVYQAGAPPPFLFHEELRADTFPGEPSSGTLTIDGDIVLPAGGTWIMKYNMEVLAWPGTTGHLATGRGFAHFTISPEPGTLALFVPLLLALPRCWHR